MDYQQRIFRSSVADELRALVKRGENIEDYFEPSVEFEESQLWPLRVELNGELPTLTPERAADPQNACLLHAYLMNLDETQASDKRLWTYMAHVPFREYVQKRWPLPHTLEEIKVSHSAKQATANSILLHWFINSNDSRALKRHALARLWWAAHLTYAPWDFSDDFKSLETDDKYVYTKFIMSNETLYTEVAERVLGSSRHILIAMLEYFRRHTENLNRNNLRPIIKELNLMSGIKKLSTLSYGEIYKLVETVAEEIVGTEEPVHA